MVLDYGDSLTGVRSLQLAITTTVFTCTLFITNSWLKYLQALTSNLQAEAKDIIEAVKEINSVKAALQNARDKIDTYHHQWFDTVNEMLVWKHLCLGDVAAKLTAAMFLLTLHPITTAVVYLFHFSITYS